MEITTGNRENNEIKANVKFDAQSVKKEYEKTCRHLSQRVNIPGFRKGKVPNVILEKNLGKEYIKQQMLESLLPGVFYEIVTKNNLDVIAEPRLNKFDFNEDGSLDLEFDFELRPEVELGDYKNFEITAKDVEYKAEDEDKELEILKERFAELKPVEGRASHDTDIVNIDFEGFVGDEAIKGGAAKGYVLDLGHSNFIEGFAPQLVGKNVNDEFTIDVKFPDEYHDEKIKGKDAKFNIKINAIKERVFPEINDEFAKKAGKFETVDELKADIKKYLTEKAEGLKKTNAVNAVFEKLLSEAKIDVHSKMIDREVEALKTELRHNAQMQGQDFDKLMETQNTEEFNENLRKEAEKRIKTTLIVAKIAKDENIEISPEDIHGKIIQAAHAYGVSPEDIAKSMKNNSSIVNAFSQQVVSEKVTDFLLNNMKINYEK
ncbi:MAG: trigger factor [Candidatus Gastranaerophilaceae bacterium]